MTDKKIDYFATDKELRGIPCPKCGKKGLHIANHPHAFGHKVPGRAYCQYCNARFTICKKAEEAKG